MTIRFISLSATSTSLCNDVEDATLRSYPLFSTVVKVKLSSFLKTYVHFMSKLLGLVAKVTFLATNAVQNASIFNDKSVIQKFARDFEWQNFIKSHSRCCL